MEALNSSFSIDNEIVEKLKGFATKIDYKKLFYDDLGPELKKIFDKKKDVVYIKHYLEASKYEYGYDGEKIDLPKALSLYKKYADLNDYFCMYKMHIIYLCEYEKFNVPLNRVLEKIYLLKCFAYLPNYIFDWNKKLFEKIDIKMEIAQMLDLEDTNLEKHKLFFDLLYYQKEEYHLTENEINLIKGVFLCYFENEEERELSFTILNSIFPKNDLDLSFYYAKNKCIYFQSNLKLGNIISDSEIENFYKEVKDKKLYELYCDYGNYLLDKKERANLEIIEIFTTAANEGYLFGCFRNYQSLIDFYDYDIIMEDYDKASNILDYLLNDIVFHRLSLSHFLLLMGYLIKDSKFPEKIMSKYLVYVKEINDYVNSILNLEEKEKERILKYEDYGEYYFIMKSYIHYFGFKDIEEQNLPKALEFLDKTNDLNKTTFSEKLIYFLRYNIKKLMNNQKLISNEELIKEKKSILEYFWNNLNLKNNVIDCYLIGEDYFEGITKIQDKSTTILIYNYSQKIFCSNIFDWKFKNEIKKFLAKEENKYENKYKDETCCVCYEKKVDKIFIPCKHNFCSFCADKIEKETKKCPICRSEILCII